MSPINQVILLGTVGTEPEVHYIDRGIAVATFKLVTDADWHIVVAWRELAEWIEQNVHKGLTLRIEGKLHNRSWEKDGVMHYRTEVIADVAQLI
ncbi:MAG: single-stranded DNA-binding protein [Paludibacteraceae bacterium]|nr:single-stranded DNA-binding protein [Paludibacteraceae bacterium]